MDITKDFTKGFNELNKHRVIAVPLLISAIVSSILIFSYAAASGYYSTAKELAILKEQYDEERLDMLINYDTIDPEYLKELAEYASERGDYQKEFAVYATEKGFDWNRLTDPLKAPKNQAVLALFVLLIVLLSLYFVCASFGMITLNMRNKELSFSNTLKQANKFFLKVIALRILVSLIVMLPLAIVGLVPFFLLMTVPALGFVAVFAYIGFMIWYLIFIALRLFFATPVLFLENKPVIETIRHTFKISKGRLKQIFVVLAIIYGISILLNSVAASPLYESVNNLLISENIIKTFIILILIIFFMVLKAVIVTFMSMFLFYAYDDFKKR